MEYELSASIISALIVGVFALAGVYFTLQGHRQLEKGRQEEIIRGVLESLYEELKVFHKQLNSSDLKNSWNKFQDVKFWASLPDFKEDDKPIFFGYFPTSVDFSIIYRSNADLIGRVKNSDLRREIVRNYTFIHILLESYRKNETLFDRCTEAYDKGEGKFGRSLLSSLQRIAPILKDNHDAVNESIEGLLEKLDEELSPKLAPVLYGFTNNT